MLFPGALFWIGFGVGRLMNGKQTYLFKNPQRSGRLSALAISLAVAAVTAVFIWARASQPVDGTRLLTTSMIWKENGVVIVENGGSPSGLQSGDLVTAVDGIEMETWARALFNPRMPRPAYEIGSPVEYTVVRGGQTRQVAVSPVLFSFRSVLADYWGVLFFALVAQLVGTFVFIRQQDDPAARILFIWAWLTCHTYAWSLGLQLSDLIQGSIFWLYSILTPVSWLLFWCASLHFGLVFPQKVTFIEQHPGRLRWIYLGAFLFFFSLTGLEWLQTRSVLAWIGSWNRVGYLISFLYLAAMVVFILWSYRHSRVPGSREKIRWVVYGGLVSGLGGLLLWILPPLIFGKPLISVNLLGVMASIFPITMAIAVWRHHLFDIDQLINRTLVYTLLTVILGLIYFGMLILLQMIFRNLAGEQDQITLVISTLSTVMLFTPLRDWLQRTIDRRFYRRKYDAQKTIERFAYLVRDEVELEAIEKALMEVVDNTLQPKQAALWMRSSTQDQQKNKAKQSSTTR